MRLLVLGIGDCPFLFSVILNFYSLTSNYEGHGPGFCVSFPFLLLCIVLGENIRKWELSLIIRKSY